MPQPLVTEEELQRALADPERRRSAFTTIVRLYSQQIYWQIRRMVYNHDDTDDLVQNVFIKAWEAIEGFRGEAKVSTWLYRIALYEALNFLKKRRHEEENVISPSERVTRSTCWIASRPTSTSMPMRQRCACRRLY